VPFWRRCHQQLQGHAPDPQTASHFFQEQAGLQPLCARERRLLLGMAGHWLALVEPLDLERLEALEKEQWLSRLQEEQEEEEEEQQQEEEKVFNTGGDTSSYKALLDEFSFSQISALNQDSYLSLDGFPGPDDAPPPPPPGATEPPPGPDRRRLLCRLIGRLLDEGRVHEACRACRYFSVHQRDVWLALRCRHLAAGPGAEPPPQEVMSEPVSSTPNCKLF